MTVDDNSSHKSTRAGHTYQFCGETCKTKFDKDPEHYLTPAKVGAEPDGDKQGCC